jgi:type I restriction enzyme S subunit
MGQIGSTYGGLSGKNKSAFGHGAAQYVTFLNVLENVRINTDLFEAVNVQPGESQNPVRQGDMLFNGTSETPEDIALAAVVEADVPNLYLNSFCFGFRIADPKSYDAVFLAYFFRGPTGRQLMSALAQGATRYNMSKRQFLQLEMALPGYREQRAIAEVLSDVDALLGSLEALIAKKRAIKQAAMQQLLTGKTRLPGFNNDWETRRLGDLLIYERPDRHIGKSAEYSAHGDIPVLTANKSFILGYTAETFGICKDLPAIVFDDFTTDSKFATSPFKVKSSAIKLLRGRHDRVSLRFAFERMQLIRFPVGDHKRYYISEYQNIRLPYPDYDEQLAVVSVLADMDAEISALEGRRDKTCAIKQGMMQQLLTGRVRLVKPSPAEAGA